MQNFIITKEILFLSGLLLDLMDDLAASIARYWVVDGQGVRGLDVLNRLIQGALLLHMQALDRV